MHFQQVLTIALAFSADRGGSVFTAPCDLYYGRILSLRPPLSSSRVIIEEDRLSPGNEWHVRLVKQGALQPPVYFPPVYTPDELESTLQRAWGLDHPPLLSRSTEPTSPQSRSASPPLRRTRSMIQMSPRRE